MLRIYFVYYSQGRKLQRRSTVPIDECATNEAIAKVAATNKRENWKNRTIHRKKSQQTINTTSKTVPNINIHRPSESEASEQNEDTYEEALLDEIDLKCIKWLEDVTRERTQNPDKIFLPHLLMP